MTLFSLGYLFRSLYLAIKYPSVLTGLLKGRAIEAEIQSRRREEWAGRREYYRSHTRGMFNLQIYLNPEDYSPVSTSIAATGWLDLPLTELMVKVLEPGMAVVDVGANIGYFTLLSAKIVGGHGIVYSFEPESFNFNLLSKSVSVNNLRNVKVFNQAVSETDGLIELYLSHPREPQAHSISRDWGRGSIKVASTTLDSFWFSLGKRHIDFVKIHVGDSDLVVLRGARRFIRDSKPFIVMVFMQEKWTRDSELLNDLISQYDVYEIVRSPFLIRRVRRLDQLGKKPVELFFSPKSPSTVE